MIGKPDIKHDGRLIICVFHIDEHEHLLLINAYGVVTDNSKATSNKLSKKNKLQKDILDTIDKAKKNFLKNAKEKDVVPKIVLQGDLQDTMTRTEADNISTKGTNKKHDLGLLKWCYNEDNSEQEFRSLAFVNQKKRNNT